MLMDLHTHSTFSFDGENEPCEIIEAAIKLGIQVLALTEHLDVNVYYDERYRNSVLIPQANKIMDSLKKEYSKDIKVIYGVEFAQGCHDCELAQKLLNEYQFDFVLGSVHTVRGMPDFYDIKYKYMDIENLLGQYFDEIYETVMHGFVNAIAHLTYPLRYITGREGIKADISIFDNKIKKIFSAMIEKNIALELNTGGLRALGFGKTEPDYDYLKLYREMGGELLTVGSDAHRISDLGHGIAQATEKAIEYGFTKLTYYEKRKPCYLPLSDTYCRLK